MSAAAAHTPSPDEGAAAAAPSVCADTLAGRNRWIQAGLALKETTAAVAGYADSVFREAHENVLEKLLEEFPHLEELTKAGPSLYDKNTVCEKSSPHPDGNGRQWHKKKDGGFAGCDDCMRVAGRSRLAGEFKKLHRLNKPQTEAWRNTDAREWGTRGRHIQMAKLFCDKLGAHEEAITKYDFKKLDGTALFNMIRWCGAFDDANVKAASVTAVYARNLWGHEGAATLSLSVRPSPALGVCCSASASHGARE
jgi:hypothetical protein